MTIEVLSIISITNQNISFSIQGAERNASVVELDTRLLIVPLESTFTFESVDGDVFSKTRFTNNN